MEYRRKCNVCGKIFCFTDEDLKNNLKNSAMAGLNAIGQLSSVFGGTIFHTSYFNEQSNRFSDKVVDYDKCPYCNSSDIAIVWDDELENDLDEVNTISNTVNARGITDKSQEKITPYFEITEYELVMSEKYEGVFVTNGNFYAVNSPVIFTEGTLFKNTKTKQIVAQLKFRNISKKIIKAVKVEIVAIDSFGEQVDGVSDFGYIDLTVSAGEQWGENIAIKMPNDSTRRIYVEVKQIVFDDGNIWSNTETTWNLLSKPSLISDELKDKELIKQFRLEYGDKSQNLYLEEHGIWHCVCGNINLSSDKECFVCKAKKELLASYDLEILKAKTSERLEEERIKREEAEEKRRIEEERRTEEARIQQLKLEEQKREKDAKRKKSLKIIASIIIFVLLVGVGIYIYTSMFIPKQKYNHALELIKQEKYEESNQILFELGDYNNSQELINENNYQLALVYIESEKYKEAATLLLDNIDYKEVKELIVNIAPLMLEDYKDDKITKECVYILGKEYFEQENYEEAQVYFKKLKGYKDSDALMCETSYILGQKEYEKGDYSKALRLMNGPYKQNYKDSVVIISKIRIAYAKQSIEEKDADYAINLLNLVIKDNAINLEETKKLLLEAKYNAQLFYIENQFATHRYSEELVRADYKDSRKRFFDYMPPKIQQDLWHLKE